ncbi:MAG: hypothetical protein ACK4GJ_02130 [bacterium]
MSGINPSGVNPNDLVNKLFQQGAKQVASTFGAMSNKTQDQQKLEKQNYDINQQYKILDKHNQSQELQKNAQHSGLVSQSLTNKELEQDEVLFDEQLLIEEGAREQGLLKGSSEVEVEESDYDVSLSSVTSSRTEADKRIFKELASRVGVSPEEIELSARQEVESQLSTNKTEMTQLKFPNETSYMETNIYQDSKPATSTIKEEKLIVVDNNPLDIELAEKEF